MTAAGLMLACGCGAAPEADPHTGEDLIIREYLTQVRGFDASQIALNGEDIFLDRDANLSRSELLEEIAAVGFTNGPGQAPQGYYYILGLPTGSPLGPARAYDVGFTFSAAVPETWRQAFRTGFSHWSTASSSDCVNFTEGTGHLSQISIVVGNIGTADDGKPAEAVGALPTFNAAIRADVPGAKITIGTGFVGEADASWRAHTAIHEIGHTLGFKHPWAGTHITGTATNQASGCCSASYFTVMDYYGDTVLSADDLASLSKVLSKVGTPPRVACRG